MYSHPTSFPGGGNSNRPGPPQYGQQFSEPGQQQTNGFAPQQTGFGGGPLHPQLTGYPGQVSQQSFQPAQQQPQHAGYPPQMQPSFQNPQPIQQSFPPPQAPQPQISQSTGQTSSQIAQSFQSTPSSQSPATKQSLASSRIPKIRLSFLTAQDQAKFEQLFKSAVGDAQALEGDKAKDLLVRSKLAGSDLSQIWVLSDTTKSGKLLFPEFALAMYLCNLKLVGKELPSVLPERIRNEVTSMVDIISFGVMDDRVQAPPRSNAPNFNTPSSHSNPPSIQQPQPQASNSQLLSQLTSQPTGFASQYIPPQPTGIQSPGFAPQPTGFQAQQTGFQQNTQASGYSGPRPAMPPMPTGYSSSLPPSQTGAPPMPLNTQPTGRPGQWGLVNTPITGLPNMEALQQRMMPQPGREGGYNTHGLSGNATVPWAVTKDEKKIYDQLFKAWDGFNKGFIGGDAAIEVMSQSGLDKPDLEKIWTLADSSNKGRLDMDEFAVAMHLIYRKLNGYPVPNRLPPELVPPSSRNLADSIGTIKSLLAQDADTRKSTGAFLQPQKTGVSYLKNHSFRSDSNGVAPGRKDATVFRNNDDDIGYKSSARRRLGGGGRTPSPVPSTSPTSERSSDDPSIEQLRKQVREKQVLLDAIDFKDENAADEDDALDRRDRRDAEDLFRRIRKVQEDIDDHPGASLRNVDSEAERRALKRQLQGLTDRLPELTSHVRKIERSIAEAQLELFRLKDAKAHPGSSSSIVGTGPAGSITESDRLKARAKAMMQQRSAALTGRSSAAGTDDSSAAARRLEEQKARTKFEKENNDRMIRDVEDSVRDFTRSLEDSLKEGGEDSMSEHERRRWDDGLGVEDEIKDFIFDLQRSSRSAKVRHEEQVFRGSRDVFELTSSRTNRGRQEVSRNDHIVDRDRTPTRYDSPASNNEIARPAPTIPTTTSATYSSYKTAEERAAFIKQQAEQRMAERLAALGLKPPTKSGETAQQRQERERKEREDRLRQAEAEDAQRDQERQRRIADESTAPPSPGAKKPPPLPPTRKNRADSAAQRDARRKSEDEAMKAKAEQEGKEKAIREQQQVQEAVTKSMENETQRQEEDLAREREAAQARLRALEEQVKQGKIKKQEEKRRKQAAEKEAKEKEAKLAAQRAELEAAKERERQLQLQLENLGDDDYSDDEEPQYATPTSSQFLSRGAPSPPRVLQVPSSQVPNSETPSSESSKSKTPSTDASPLAAPTAPPLSQTSSYSSDSKNPFFKKLSQSNESARPPATQPSIIPSPIPDTNPFHRLSQSQSESTRQAHPPFSSTPTGSRPSRVRPEEDEWSVVDSTEDSSDDDDTSGPSGGSAKQLASILFGTMAPPRPLSAADDKDRAKSPSMSPITPVAPPMATFSGSSAPPPAPPPMPPAMVPIPGGPPSPPPPMPAVRGGEAPPPPPPPMSVAAPGAGRGALLGDITSGKKLRKVETKDRSTASTAGRVLG